MDMNTAMHAAPPTLTLRRRSAQGAPAPTALPEHPQPLTAEDLRDAHGLIDEAATSNHDLMEAGTALHAAQASLHAAEAHLAAVRQRNAELHTRLAPLLHRLPA
jgi:multidrug resistance efflux pump